MSLVDFDKAFDPFSKALIFSGCDFKNEEDLIRLGLDPRVKRDSEYGLKKIAEIKASYEEYKNEKIKFSYGKFLKIIEKNRAQLNDPNISTEARDKVANKLVDLAKDRIFKEENFNIIHKFFHIIAQFFQGHHLQTKGEWGLELAAQIKKANSEIYKTALRQCLYPQGFSFGTQEGKLNAMKDKINSLSPDEFKDVLKTIVFSSTKKDFPGDNKFIFYNNLYPEKKEIFEQELLERNDWYEQLFEFFEFITFDENEFGKMITDNLTSKFLTDLENVIKIYNKNSNDISTNKAFKMFILKAVKKLVDMEDYSKIAKLDSFLLHNLLHNTGFDFSLKKIIESDSRILTAGDKEKINHNLRLL